MERVNQQDELNAPVVQEQVIIEGRVPVEEQKLEQHMGQGQRVALMCKVSRKELVKLKSTEGYNQ